MPGVIIGCDPGLKGGIAFLDTNNKILSVVKMPCTKGQIDLPRLFTTFTGLRGTLAYLEEVGSMPGDGVVSAFSFGHNYGCLKMACAGNGVEMKFVRPAHWKIKLGIAVGGDTKRKKGAAFALADQLFPECSHLWGTTRDGLAEAALIAFYGACTEGITVNGPFRTDEIA